MNKPQYLLQGVKKIFSVVSTKKGNVIPRQLLNYFWAFFKIPYLVPLPVEIQVEPSLRCNLHCKMCNINKDIKAGSFLSPASFSRLLDETKPLRSLSLTGMGESLLNKNLEKFIDEAASCNTATVFITNAQLLTRERARTIVASKVGRISISMESGKPRSYEAIRLGAKFERLKENITNLTTMIRKRKSPIVVTINVVLLRHNLDDLNHIFKIIEFAKDCQVPEITFQNPHDVVLFEMKNYFHKDKHLLLEKLTAIQKCADSSGIKIYLPPTDIQRGSCYYPWIYPQITANGELLPCPVMHQFVDYAELIKKYSFGNVFTDGFDKIWNSKKAFLFGNNTLKINPISIAGNVQNIQAYSK